MKVSGINNQINFGKVFLVTSSTNSPYIKSRKIDDSTYGVSQVLNSRNHRLYSKKDGNKIRSFFAENIDDYNGYNGVKMVRTCQDIFLLTGNDIKEYNNFIEPKKKQNKEIVSNQFMSLYAKNAQIERLEREEYEYLDKKKQGTFSLSSSKFAGWMSSYDKMMGYSPCNYKLDRFSFYSYNENQQDKELRL